MRLLRIALTTLITAAVVATPASASTTFTPDGGPEVNFVGTDITFTNIQADQELNCEQVDFAGSIDDPGVSRQFGDNAGILSDLTTSTCTNPLAGSISMTLNGSPTVSITGHPLGTEWPARLTDVSAFISVAGCSFNVEGDVDGVFDSATQVVTPTANTLTIVDEPAGFMCAIPGIAKGQTFTVDGSWTNVPPAGSSPLFLSAGTPDTFAPHGGPTTNFTSSDIELTVIQADQSVTCPRFDLTGDLLSPGASRPVGANVGELDDLTAHGCSNPISGSVLFQQNGPWDLTVTGGPSGSLWPVQIANISAFLDSAGCAYNIGGSLNGTFDTSTQVLTPSTSELEITDTPTGFLCPILGVAQGQDVVADGSWTNVPPTGSTPLTFAVP